ncbi:MAG: DEAD/DEAH box helicase [Deltaproteobacteria bacterium CG_4_9_14_0_2_um_filter_42_21]|nr:MAG: DEAD/DEAH box helicase [Deltaproteobacteria bacterium CG_4_9_14_0_2_um_filter_42_21]
MNTKTFRELQLVEPIARALDEKKYEHPTPIQAAAIPSLLAGCDMIGCAQTGTGKTAAFSLPILHRLFENKKRAAPRGARVLVLTPTRELASQVSESFKAYGRHIRLSHALVFGGVGQTPQVKALRNGVDVLVATPGRLLDLMNQKHASLKTVEVLVLDEADRMLDMGFLPDIKKIIATLPRERQTLLFSATMAPEILSLAKSILINPVEVQVAPPATTAELIDERVMFVAESNKKALLSHLLKTDEVKRALIFTRTKHGANRLVTHLEKTSVQAKAIHGNKSQTARTAALKDFSQGLCKVLVATDIAARGIDVAGITHVINYDLPNEPASYVHRIGRTARSGTKGIAISFCANNEHVYLRDIEKLLKRSVAIDKTHKFHDATPIPKSNAKPVIRGRNKRFNKNRRQSPIKKSA